MRDSSTDIPPIARARIVPLPRALAAALLALVVIAVLVMRALPGMPPDELPAAVDGSPSPPAEQFDWRSIDPANVLPGRYGNFAVDAPDGEAHVRFDFGAPRRFASLRHAYTRPAPDPWYRIRELRVDYSDDATTWSTVGPLAADAADDQARIRFDLGQAGAHRWWRVVATASDAHRLAIFGSLRFETPPSWSRLLPLDVLLGLGSLLAFAVSRRVGVARARAALIAVSCWVVSLSLALALAASPSWVLLGPDSFAYLAWLLNGELSSAVTAGYPLFVSLVDRVLGLDRLPLLQLSAELAAMVAAAFVVHETRRTDAVVFLLAVPLLLGALAQFGLALGTEALFLSGFTAAAAALGAATHEPSRRILVTAGIGLSVAVAVKSVGIVLVVPALMAMRFVPSAARRRYALLAILPPLLVYLLMCADGLRRFGEFAPQAFGGVALVGHVAWIEGSGDAADDSRAGPEAQRALTEALAPLLADRPDPRTAIRRSIEQGDPAALDAYVDRSSMEYGALLVAVDTHLRSRLRDPVSGRDPAAVSLNAEMMALARQRIASDPAAYAAHVAAHFHGLWRDAGTGGYIVRNSATSIPHPLENLASTRANVPLLDSWLHPLALERIAPRIAPRPDARQSLDAAARQSLLRPGLWPPSAEVPAAGTTRRATTILGFVALALCALWLAPRHIAAPWSAQIATALMLNGYFLGHSLFQVTLVRYAHVALPAMLLLAIGVASTALRLLLRRSASLAGVLAGAPAHDSAKARSIT